MRNPHHTNFALVATLASWASNLLLFSPDLESQQRLISRIFARLRAPWHPLCRMCRSPRYAQRGSLLDTHTNQQVRAPLSLPSRASCASSAIATANSSSHRATSESTVGVRFPPSSSSSSVSAAPPCRLFRRPRLQAHALLPTAHPAMLLPRRRCLFSYAAAPAPIRASPSSFSRRTTCESRRRAFTFLDVVSKWWLRPLRCARAAAARARRVITGVPTANHAVPP